MTGSDFFQLTFRFFPKVYRAETIIKLSSRFFPWPGHTALTSNQLCTHSHTHKHTPHTACLGWVDGCVMQLALNAFSPIKYATQGLYLHFAYTLPCNMHPDRPYPTHYALLSAAVDVVMCRHSEGSGEPHFLHITLPRIL